jgi:3-hydroxyacyl-[acyl-carrier-protein] dehydratase
MTENVSNSMDIHEILEHLTHRYPFVVIDTVL